VQDILDDLIRQHFWERTARFLAPLNRYCATLVTKSLPHLSPSTNHVMRSFSETDFLKSLGNGGVGLSFKGKATPASFYTKFIRCSNFTAYLEEFTATAGLELDKQHFKYLCDIDIESKTEVELVDIYLRLREVLPDAQQSDRYRRIPEDQVAKIKSQISRIHSKLSPALRDAVKVDDDAPI